MFSQEKPRCHHGNLEEDCPFCVEPDYRIVPRPAPKESFYITNVVPVEDEDEDGNRTLICIHRVPIDQHCEKCEAVRQK